MMDFSKIDSFIDKLKEMRGIAELDRHLLHLLLEMKPSVSETTQKFLCLCFSLWDDGNTRVPLDAKLFKERWLKKWDALKILKKSQEESFDFAELEKSFNEIIESGIADLSSNGFSEIIGDKAPLLKTEGVTKVDGKPYHCQFLYMAKHFKAKGEIQDAMARIFGKKIPGTPAIKQISNMNLNDDQKNAVRRGQNENLIITGGPGTGKTTVVLYILWNVLENIVKDVKTEGLKSEEISKEQAKALSEYTIYLAAPSGKAADRMSESLKKGLNDVNEDLKKSLIYAKLKDLEGMTIHRLLKYSRSDNGFSYNAKNQFPEKSIFVIDEASMVDVNLFSSLLQAIPSQGGDKQLVTRLFILGDPYQLPSVDAGAVLGNILDSASKANYTAELKISMRFPPESKIGQLASAIKVCADDQKMTAPDKTFVLHPVFSKNETKDGSAETSTDAVYYYSLPQKSKDKSGEKLDKAPTKKEEQEYVSKFLENWIGDFKDLPKLVAGIDPEALENPSDELKKLCNDIWNKTLEKRILAAERRGAIGVEQINETIGNLIKGQKEKPKSNSRYFEGQLLILTQNQAMYRLYNGDTGIVLFKDSVPYIMLKKPNGKTGAEQRDFVAYPLSLLPADAVESAFAITIHKSQGSEYDHVTMFLPKEEGHPLLNNQILYTGITRAKKTVTIIATDKTFKAACETVIKRDTGIEI
ncbi:ATP-dependent RecD-like DNA helicase [Fibrobacter sp.]|uniref:ATP-dependent DNA helicase n=1 Tax=Fibrobacter sp. TaxID=35828 RepID=UPI003863432E